MKRLLVVAVLVGLATGGAYCYVNYEAEVRRGQDGLESITIRPKPGSSAPRWLSGMTPDAPSHPLVRIATFNLGGLDEKRLENRRVGAVLAHVIRRFDVVAVQGIRAEKQVVLIRLIEQINADGPKYDFATCPAVKADPAGQRTAFLLNRASIEIDRSTLQLVSDPRRRFRHRPLVALFRVRGPDPTQAFTFKLINVHIDPDQTAVELDLLDDVYRAVRDDQSDEDDVILLGYLGAGADRLDRWDDVFKVISSTTDTPTTLPGTRPVDNILFDPRPTTEFTGRAGVLDLMQEFGLTWREVSEVSNHLPVWAEFSSTEGDCFSHVADQPSRTTR